MEMRPIGKTHLKTSPIGLGLFKIGRNQGAKHPEAYELPDDDQVIALLKTAQTMGVNLLDTAASYGTSEERLGTLMRRLDWLGGRENWVISTKVGEEFEHGQSRYDFRPEHVIWSLERSLKRIGVDHLDMVLIHSNGDDLTILNQQGTLQALADCRDRGLVRAIGLSGKTVSGGLRAIELGADVLMATLNAQESDDMPLIEAAQAAQVGVLVKKPLGSGHLATGEAAILTGFRQIFERGGAGVSSVIVGTLNPAHLRQNVELCQQALLSLHQMA